MFPKEIMRLPQWVNWKALPDESRPGKIKKIPINPHTGGQAQSNNPSTWATYEVAQAESNKYSGIGFMFANGYFGVDIDDCEGEIEQYKNGDKENIIYEFIHSLRSYSEYSVSGRGIHIICKGNLPLNGRRKKNVEMYDSGRFFIMTSNSASEYQDILEGTDIIKSLHEKYIGGGTTPKAAVSCVLPLNISQAEIIKLAENSKQGRIFADLYSGDWQSYYTSQSEADMSFCNMLSFWCQRDEAMMDAIFRTSGLMRDKWDRVQSGSTYGAITINKAVRDCNKVYEPKPDYAISIGFNETAPKKDKLYSFDDTGNAEHMYDLFGSNIRYNYIDKKWLYFDSRKWHIDNTGEIKKLVDERNKIFANSINLYVEISEDEDEAKKQFAKHLKLCRSSKSKTAMIKETEHLVPILPSQMDIHTSLLNVTNGIINLVTGELSNHDASKYMSRMCYVEYTDKSDCPIWENFLKDIFSGDKELIKYIQKAIGYSLTGSNQEQCAFFCLGDGRNGKSTFLDTISNILGDYAINIQPDTIMAKRQSSGINSDIARLKGARFVTCVEPEEGVRLNEGLIKQLTGGDKVTARKLYGEEFEFNPEFKLWMGTNHKPIIRGTDKGIWRRIHLIPFNATIADNKVDKQLKYKLRQEYPAILNWAVEGCLLHQREGLKLPKAVEIAVEEYKNEMDVVSKFLSECTVKGGNSKASDLYKAYTEWAKTNNEYCMSNTKFGMEMVKRFEKYRGHGGSVSYKSVSLTSNPEQYSINF